MHEWGGVDELPLSCSCVADAGGVSDDGFVDGDALSVFPEFDGKGWDVDVDVDVSGLEHGFVPSSEIDLDFGESFLGGHVQASPEDVGDFAVFFELMVFLVEFDGICEGLVEEIVDVAVIVVFGGESVFEVFDEGGASSGEHAIRGDGFPSSGGDDGAVFFAHVLEFFVLFVLWDEVIQDGLGLFRGLEEGV